MKTLTQIRIASLSLLAVLCLTLAALPASAQVLYDNGPGNGNADAWQINGGHVVSNSFQVSADSIATGFSFYVWELPGDTLTSVDWSITTQENGGTVLSSGTASGVNLTDQFISTNKYGYPIHEGIVYGATIDNTKSNHFWLNLQNATGAGGDPVYWDENSGVGCQSPGCPSLASDSALGTIPSEAFTINGSPGGTTPEPSSLALFGSGMLGLGGLLRRRFLG